MKGRNIITINGRLYDAVTGMPAAKQQPPSAAVPQPQRQPKLVPPQNPPSGKVCRAFSDITPVKTAHQAPQPTAGQVGSHTVHQQPQKSHTLYRAALKRPEHAKTKVHHKPTSQRSPLITRFGPDFDNSTAKPPSEVQPAAQADAPAPVHPVVAKALAQHNHQQPATHQPQQTARSSHELKEALIKERLAEVETAEVHHKKNRRSLFGRRPKLTTILSSSLAILLLGGYLTFINLPNISMRVAATRAGIAASFPSYSPDGYSFQGPITYAPGEVSINYKSNTNNSSFTLKQKSSNWDSQAVLDNYVSKQAENYLTYQEQGLTIYSFDNKAAWANGGLLYSLEGNASLSSEQILRLATSL